MQIVISLIAIKIHFKKLYIIMASKRQSQVASVIKRNFSIVLQQEGSYIYGAQALVTVTNVQVTPDMGEAKIYLSVFNVEDKQTVLLEMEDNIGRLKQQLAQRIRKHVRRIPSLQLFLDDTLDEMYRINEVLNRINTGGSDFEI
jgi:ribosome-binding factor A